MKAGDTYEPGDQKCIYRTLHVQQHLATEFTSPQVR